MTHESGRNTLENALCAAMERTFEELTFSEVSLETTGAECPESGLASAIRVDGHPPFSLFLVMSAASIHDFLRTICDEQREHLEESLLHDALGEFLNVIAGNLARELGIETVRFGLPQKSAPAETPSLQGFTFRIDDAQAWIAMEVTDRNGASSPRGARGTHV